ncbi:MAG: electron transfer flavoprotein subunit alpha [Flavobacteriales bacterium]|nr:electron transfer flavoprotein beta subunit/FixA family protein [Flavobacteriaceae bacterium]PHX92239.1 MAG: electron transfer flavoprotein subunit alpha [Flavobacteriales bacterium]
MKILVCISVVPDTTTKITFIENNTQLNLAGVQYILNPYDELAITRGLDIAEANGGNLSIVHVGPVESEPVIRKALSMGADQAIRIDALATDSQFVAEEIAKIAGEFDLILTGRESIDYNGGAVCGLLGALLEIPSINVVTRIDYADGIFTFDRDIDGGRETIRCAGKCVASAQKDLCEPRIPTMRGIMAARSKPLQIIAPQGNGNFSTYSNYELPPSKTGVKLIAAHEAGKLIDLLKNEAKII